MDSRNYWQRALPPWPVVPARLWLTGAGTALVVFSPVFNEEIWLSHPLAVPWGLALLGLLVLAGGVQAIGVLWRWPQNYAGLGWLKAALRGAAAAASIGIAILLLMLWLLSCIVLIRAL